MVMLKSSLGFNKKLTNLLTIISHVLSLQYTLQLTCTLKENRKYLTITRKIKEQFELLYYRLLSVEGVTIYRQVMLVLNDFFT